MSDRIMVMHEGHVTGFLDRAEANQVKIMELARTSSWPLRGRNVNGNATPHQGRSAVQPRPKHRRWPPEVSIFLVLLGIALIFELLGWIFVGQSFLFNPQRLTVMILQVSVIGIIAVGVTQVIITGGIDLSSGSVVGLTAMVAASLAQHSDFAARRLSVADRPAGVHPGRRRPARRRGRRPVNGTLIATTGIPPFIATLGMMVTARGIAKWYTRGQPVSMLTEPLRRDRLRRLAGGRSSSPWR